MNRNDLVTAFATAFITGLALMFVMWGVNLNTGADAPGNLSIAFGIGLFLGFFTYIMWKVKPRTVTKIVEKETEPPNFTVIQDADTDYPQGVFGLPAGITIDHMIELARQIITLKSDFSHSALAGPGRPFSRTEYEAMRKYCELRKWVAWNNPKYKSKGLSVRKLGVDAFTQLLDSPYPSSVFRLYGYDVSREDAHAHTRTQGAQWES